MRTLAAFSAILGLVLATSSAQASCTKVDASTHTVTCNSLVLGLATFKPALTTAGGAGNPAIKVKGTLYGCTDNTDSNLVIDKGSVTGLLTGQAGNSCLNLLGSTSVTGTITVKWKATSTSTDCYLSNVTTLTPNSLNGTTFTPGGSLGGTYGAFQIPGASPPMVSGAYAGGNNGATTTFYATTTEDITTLGTFCGATTGLKGVHFGLASITLQ